LTLGLTRSQVGQQFDDFLGTKPASQAVSQPGVALRLKSGNGCVLYVSSADVVLVYPVK